MKELFISLICFSFLACQNGNANTQKSNEPTKAEAVTPVKTNAVAYFASGCFWCVEAVFESVKGVGEVESGYTGGTEKNPSYELICTGSTRHAEAVRVNYNSDLVSYETLLTVFFDSHDPSTLNQQGPDRGPQYRSAIFYQNDKERIAAQSYIDGLKTSKKYKQITTQLAPLTKFYIAEEYHQDYEKKHPNNSYVRAVSVPRIEAFKRKHPELLK
ncbi:MAG: peptide-methionine (S)-S-oxide reductase [Lentimonas sp.]|jgi:peptide-methionine (S)-S-oxide reductase